MAIGQQAAAWLVVLPLVPIFPLRHTPTLSAIWAVTALAILSTSLGYLLFFYLLTNVGATSTLSVTFLVPLSGVLWSALFLGERVGPGTAVGLVLILGSVMLVTNFRPWRRAMPVSDTFPPDASG